MLSFTVSTGQDFGMRTEAFEKWLQGQNLMNGISVLRRG